LWRPDEEERGRLASSTAAFITDCASIRDPDRLHGQVPALPLQEAADVHGNPGRAARCRVSHVFHFGLFA